MVVRYYSYRARGCRIYFVPRHHQNSGGESAEKIPRQFSPRNLAAGVRHARRPSALARSAWQFLLQLFRNAAAAQFVFLRLANAGRGRNAHWLAQCRARARHRSRQSGGRLFVWRKNRIRPCAIRRAWLVRLCCAACVAFRFRRQFACTACIARFCRWIFYRADCRIITAPSCARKQRTNPSRRQLVCVRRRFSCVRRALAARTKIAILPTRNFSRRRRANTARRDLRRVVAARCVAAFRLVVRGEFHLSRPHCWPK